MIGIENTLLIVLKITPNPFFIAFLSHSYGSGCCAAHIRKLHNYSFDLETGTLQGQSIFVLYSLTSVVILAWTLLAGDH